MMAAALVALLCLGSVARGFAQGGEGRPFITKWYGEAGKKLKFPIVGKDYKLVIKNEKGEVVKTEEKVTVTGEDDSYYHPFTPSADGVYTVEAGPEGVKYMRMKAEWSNEKQKYIPSISNDKLLEVVQFGTVEWRSMNDMFLGCQKMVFAEGIDTPDLTKVTDMSKMFADCSTFNQPLEKWEVSKVTNMREMFWGCSTFNQPLNHWDVSKVTDMRYMFEKCRAFNQPLEKWDVSKVHSMYGMFWDCSAFNQPLEKWDVSTVHNMYGMFLHCSSFNQPLEKWDVNQVTDMHRMFEGCSAFNQPLEKWDVSKVTSMDWMFSGCSSFNQPLGVWKLQTKIGGLSTTDMSVENYSQSLIGWAKQTDGASNIQFGEEVKGLLYNDAGKEARDKLIARGWTFKGDFYKPSEKVAITLDKNGEGTLAIEGYNDEGLKAVVVGTKLTVIATPKEGYKLTSLTAGTQDILATKKFTVMGAVTVKAVFKEIEKVSITLAKEGEGTLAIEGYNDAELKAVAVGTELTVIATPKEGYMLTSLTVESQDIFATKKFTVKKAVTVKAVFKKKENNGGGNNGGNNGGGNNGGNNGGGTWQPQTPKAVEDAVLASLAVAPNPFTSQLRIENPEGVSVRYELVNGSGVVVRSGAFVASEVIVDTEALPAGLYFVRIEAQNGAKRVVKVVKY